MKQESLNSFGGGLNKDLNVLSTPAEVLTDCLNGTITTYNGNEFSLQNDMGNARVGTAFLKDGYIPVGMKEYGGIIYVAAYNPETNKGQVGCFPSPQQLYSSTNKITNYSIDLSQFYISSDEISGRYDTKDTVIGTQNIREIVRVENQEVTLYPGDKFIFTAELTNDVLQAIRDEVLTINLALLTPSGVLEYIDERYLNTYQYIIKNDYGSSSVRHWILDTSRLDTSINLDNILAEKNDQDKEYIQILRSNSSGKLVVVANLNTIENTNYTVEYTKNSDNNYGIKVVSSINTKLKEYGVVSTAKVIKNGQEDSNPDLKYIPYEEDEIEISKDSDFSEGTEIKISAAPYTKYGIVDKFYQEFSLSYDNIQNKEDDLKVFKYWVFDDRIEIQLSYTYIDFYNTKVKNNLKIYDPYKNIDADPIATQSINELNGTQIVIIPFTDTFKKGKLYICELERIYTYTDNEPSKKSLYNYLYMTPLFNGENIIGLEPLKVDGVSSVYNNYLGGNNIILSENKNLGTSKPDDRLEDNLFTCNYQQSIVINNEETFNLSQVTINRIEYDWDTYFIGNGELKLQLNNIEYPENIQTTPTVKINEEQMDPDDLTEWLKVIEKKLEGYIPNFTEEKISDESSGDSYTQLTLKYPFIVDYEVGHLQNKITHGWAPFLTDKNVSGLGSPFTFDYWEQGDEDHYGPGKQGQLVASIVQQKEGLAKHVIRTDPTNTPRYKDDDGRWKAIAAGHASEYYPNFSYSFDEENTQKSFNQLMTYAQEDDTNKTIGIVAGGWGDQASLGFEDIIVNAGIRRHYRKNNDGYAWYEGSWDIYPEFDAGDNWMFACMQELNEYGDPGGWRVLNLGSKRYEDKNYLCVDELLKQLFSQLYVYKSNYITYEDSSNYYTRPVPEAISVNTSDNNVISVTINFNITEDNPFNLLSGIDSSWDGKVTNDYLPELSINTFKETINLKFSEINTKVYNYIKKNKDNYIVQEEKESLLDKDKIYIADLKDFKDAAYNNGILELNPFNPAPTQAQLWSLSRRKLKFRLKYKEIEKYVQGISCEDLNNYFVYKDGNIYLKYIQDKQNGVTIYKFPIIPLIFTKGVPSESVDSFGMDEFSVCQDLRFISTYSYT